MARNSSNARRHGMVAVVLGTAIAAMGHNPAQAGVAEKDVHNISRYCTACWRNARLPADRWGDCTQAVFHRLLERVPTKSWQFVLSSDGEARREFLRAIDTVKKRAQRERQRTNPLITDVADARGNAQLADDRELFQKASAEVLSDRQQVILQQTCQGWTIPEIAEGLQTSCERVSDEKYKAIKKLQQHFKSHGEMA